MSAEQQVPQATMMVFRLTEGFVLDYGGYTVALTNADDLAERVRVVGKQLSGEVGFQEPAPAPPVTQPTLPRQGDGAPSSALKEATAVPNALELVAQQDGVVPTAQIESEWANVRRMIAFMAAGFDNKGKEFTRAMFDAALPMFAPHIDPKEAEFELSEFLASMHDNEE